MAERNETTLPKKGTQKQYGSNRKAKYKSHPAICVHNKNKRVMRASNGKFLTAAALNAHREKVEAERKTKKPVVDRSRRPGSRDHLIIGRIITGVV